MRSESFVIEGYASFVGVEDLAGVFTRTPARRHGCC